MRSRAYQAEGVAVVTSENHGAAKRHPGSESQAGEDWSTRLAPNLDVLGVREDGAWCAIALEMSLRGYGETFDDALDALVEAIEAQVTFAVQHDNLDQIFVPAEPHYFRLHADVKRAALKRKLLDRVQSGLPDYRVGDLQLPRPTAPSFKQTSA